MADRLFQNTCDFCDKRQCPHCGGPITRDMSYCPECGWDLSTYALLERLGSFAAGQRRQKAEEEEAARRQQQKAETRQGLLGLLYILLFISVPVLLYFLMTRYDSRLLRSCGWTVIFGWVAFVGCFIRESLIGFWMVVFGLAVLALWLINYTTATLIVLGLMVVGFIIYELLPRRRKD